MSKYDKIKAMRVALYNHMQAKHGAPVIFADLNADAPPKPYVTLKLSYIQPETFNEREDEFYSEGDTLKKGWHKRKMVYEKVRFEVTVYDKGEGFGINLKSYEIAQTLQDWFSTYGERFLERNNIVVTNVSDIIDKSVHIVDSYDYKVGFSFTLRLTHEKIEVPLYQEGTSEYNYDIIDTVIVTNERTGDRITTNLEGGDKRA